VALARVDLGDVGAAFGRATYFWAALAVLVMTASKVLAAARWQLYLSRVGRAPLLGLMGAYTVGTLLNTLLPLRAGDFAKIQIVASRYGLTRAGLTSSVFVVEAVLDAVTLLGLLMVSLLFLGVGFIPALLIWTLVLLAGGGLTAGVLASRFLPRQFPRWRWLAPLPEAFVKRAQAAWPRFLDGLATLGSHRLFLRALSLHVAEWLMRAAVMWLFGLAFALDVSPSAYVVVTVALSVFTVFPVTFMNIGTYQVVVVEVLGGAGVPRGEAFAYAVAAQALSHFWIIVMGLAALWALRIRPGQALHVERGLSE
jgi:hypothetical protein